MIYRNIFSSFKALEVLGLYLPDLYHTKLRRRRMRKIASDEMPWRCMVGIVKYGKHLSNETLKIVYAYVN